MNITNGPAVCRICMCGETSIPYLGNQAGEPLISPCKCTGTMGLYHRSCLEHWLTLTHTKICEICKHSFKLDQKYQTFYDYICQKGYRKRRNGRKLRNPFIDLGFIVCMIPVAGTALVLCMNGASLAAKKYHLAFENRNDPVKANGMEETLNETLIEFALFVFIAMVIFVAVCTFIIVTFVNNWSQFKKWQERNQIFYVVDDETSITQQNTNFKNSMGRIRECEEMPEIVRSEAIQIETINVIQPACSSSPHSSSLEPSYDLSEEIPMVSILYTKELNEIHKIVSSTPQMYGLPPRDLTLSPIALDDLYSETTLSDFNEVENIKIPKSQSVYSVCSFTKGVKMCSTPRMSKQSEVNLSTFKGFNPMETSCIEEEPFETKGRFQVEKITTPQK
ncbi:unnamed protein product [Caenorhabditis angaria]|uniref:RING-CH-type domain-containing protein n=1 Tax=Caenorhabditis angaria TaxID=860376 RepID=A0A9P1ID50_9PELO|nr:unnamed protein product [Caenorhabditis angaria]